MMTLGVSLRLLSLDHIEFQHSNFNLKVESFKFGFQKEPLALAIDLSGLSMLHRGNNYKIASRASFLIALKSFIPLVKKDEEAAFLVKLKGVSASTLSAFVPQNHSDEMEKQKNSFSRKLFTFLNKTRLVKTKFEVEFEDFDLQKTIPNYSQSSFRRNSLAIHKISLLLEKKLISKIALDYSLNGQKQTIIAKIQGQKKSKENSLMIDLYSETDHLILQGIEKTNLFFLGGIKKFLLSVDDDKVFFEGSVQNPKVQLWIFNHREHDAENLELKGSYNLKSNLLTLEDFSFNLLDENEIINFSGKLQVNKSYLNLTGQANNSFKTKHIYTFWPYDKGEKVKDTLIEIIKSGLIEGAAITLKTGFNSASTELDVNFNLVNGLVNKAIYDRNYQLKFNKSKLKIDLLGTSIESDAAQLNDSLDLEQLKAFIPFSNGTKTKADFKINTTVEKVEKVYQEVSENKKGYKGSIKGGEMVFDCSVEIPHISSLTFADINLNLQGKVKEFLIKRDVSSHSVKADQLRIRLKNKNFEATGSLELDKIKLPKVVFEGKMKKLSGNRSAFQNELVRLILPLDQKFLQEILAKQSIFKDFNGTLTVDFIPKSMMVKVNLKYAGFTMPIAEIEKLEDQEGELHLILNRGKFNQISLDKIQIPGVVGKGYLEISPETFKLQKAQLSCEKFKENKIDFEYLGGTDHKYKIKSDFIEILDIKRILQDFDSEALAGEIKKLEEKPEVIPHSFDIVTETLKYNSKNILKNLKILFTTEGNKITKIDSTAYTSKKDGYLRVFFDKPVLALILNQVGSLNYDLFGSKAIQKGNLSVYANLKESGFEGILYLQRFKLVESHLLSTILRLYSFSGMNVFKMLHGGIDFSHMTCGVSSTGNIITLKRCHAFSDVMLLNAKAEINLMENSGAIEGMVLPLSIMNLPMIILGGLSGQKQNAIMDRLESHRNFLIYWDKENKPRVKANPISFVMPSILSHLFSHKREKTE